MKKCNCGAFMQIESIFDKTYVCLNCGATLMIDSKGIYRWSDTNGKRSTYLPKESEDTHK